MSLIDWKTGTQEMLNHHYQLQGYDYLFQASGLYGRLDENDFLMKHFGITRKYGMCVKLGGSSYLNTMYDLTTNKDFFRGWHRFNNPTATTYNAKSRTTGRMKLGCVFCPHRNLRCPIFSFTQSEVINNE